MSAAVTNVHAGMPMQSQGDGDQQMPCKSSAVVCCQAMTSCGLSIQLGRTVSGGDTFPSEDRLPAVPFQTPLNRITLPEPPPPKA